MIFSAIAVIPIGMLVAVITGAEYSTLIKALTDPKNNSGFHFEMLLLQGFINFLAFALVPYIFVRNAEERGLVQFRIKNGGHFL